MIARPVRRIASLAGLLLAASTTACAASDAVTCRVGADCASGVCQSDNTCAGGPATTGTGGAGQGGDGAGAGQGGDSEGGAGAGQGGGAVCAPNGDGTITREEVPLLVGIAAKYEATSNVPVDTAGSEGPDGSRVWKLDGSMPGDHLVVAETLDPANAWWGAKFAGATYGARLAEDYDLIGVFRATGDALLLVGVVSPDDGALRTELVYDPPAKVLAFPMQDGSTWTTTSNVTGQLEGVLSFYSETYDSTVDAHGSLSTPYADFEVLRVRVERTRLVGAVPTTQRTFAFVTECFGSVATIASKENELAVEFPTAAAVRRLSP